MAEACVCRNLFVELKRAESVCFLFKCMNVLNFRASNIGVFSWHYLFLFSPVYQCLTFHTLATVILLLEEHRKWPKSEVSTRYIMYKLGVTRLKLKNFPFFGRRNIDESHYLLQYLFAPNYFDFIIITFDSNFFLRYQVANQLYHKIWNMVSKNKWQNNYWTGLS